MEGIYTDASNNNFSYIGDMNKYIDVGENYTNLEYGKGGNNTDNNWLSCAINNDLIDSGSKSLDDDYKSCMVLNFKDNKYSHELYLNNYMFSRNHNKNNYYKNIDTENQNNKISLKMRLICIYRIAKWL